MFQIKQTKIDKKFPNILTLVIWVVLVVFVKTTSINYNAINYI